MLVGGRGVNKHMENSICFVVFIFESFPKVYSHKSNWPKISDQEGEKNKMSWRQTVLSIIFHSIIYWRTFKFFSRFLTFVPKLQSMDWSTLLILLSIGLRDSFGLPWLQWVRQKNYGWRSNCHYFSIVFPIWINDSYLWEISRIQDNHQHQNHKLSSL